MSENSEAFNKKLHYLVDAGQHPAVAVEFFKKAYHEARRIRWDLEARHVDARIAEQAALDKLIEALIVADMHL